MQSLEGERAVEIRFRALASEFDRTSGGCQGAGPVQISLPHRRPREIRCGEIGEDRGIRRVILRTRFEHFDRLVQIAEKEVRNAERCPVLRRVLCTRALLNFRRRDSDVGR